MPLRLILARRRHGAARLRGLGGLKNKETRGVSLASAALGDLCPLHCLLIPGARALARRARAGAAASRTCQELGVLRWPWAGATAWLLGVWVLDGYWAALRVASVGLVEVATGWLLGFGYSARSGDSLATACLLKSGYCLAT